MIELSADLGEGAPDEDRIWPLVHAANVACGGHTGDDSSMRRAAELAQQCGVRVGAHPSYPDRENFGRQTLHLPPAVLGASIVRQIEALRRFASVQHVKPHGALYNDAHHDRDLAKVIVDAIRDVPIVCSDKSQMAVAARERGVRVIREAFGDRRYAPDGSLTPRGRPNSLLTVEEAAEQVERLVREGAVTASDGTRVEIPFDTICIHSDMERAVERLRAIRARLGLD